MAAETATAAPGKPTLAGTLPPAERARQAEMRNPWVPGWAPGKDQAPRFPLHIGDPSSESRSFSEKTRPNGRGGACSGRRHSLSLCLEENIRGWQRKMPDGGRRNEAGASSQRMQRVPDYRARCQAAQTEPSAPAIRAPAGRQPGRIGDDGVRFPALHLLSHVGLDQGKTKRGSAEPSRPLHRIA